MRILLILMIFRILLIPPYLVRIIKMQQGKSNDFNSTPLGKELRQLLNLYHGTSRLIQDLPFNLLLPELGPFGAVCSFCHDSAAMKDVLAR